MSLFLLKSILATFFLLAGLIAVICMLTLMGRSDLKISAIFLRRFHKISGFVFFILLIVISYFCIKYWIVAGDNLSTRAIFHGVLALALFAVLLIKILIVQFYKQLIRFVPALGMTVFCMAFVVFCLSANALKRESTSFLNSIIHKHTEFVVEIIADSQGNQGHIPIF